MKTFLKNFLPFVSYWTFAGVFLLLPALVFSFVSNTTTEIEKFILIFSYTISCLIFIACNILIGLQCKLKEFLTGFVLLELQLVVSAVLLFNGFFKSEQIPLNILFGYAERLSLNKIFALILSLLLPSFVFLGLFLQKKNVFANKIKTERNEKSVFKIVLKNTFPVLAYWILTFFFIFSMPVFSSFLPESVNEYLNIILLTVFNILFIVCTFAIGYKQKLSEFIGGFVLLELQFLICGILIFTKQYNNFIYCNILYGCFNMMRLDGAVGIVLSLLLPCVSTFSGYFFGRKNN